MTDMAKLVERIWSFDDGHIGRADAGENSLRERIIPRPPSISQANWYDYASAVTEAIAAWNTRPTPSAGDVEAVAWRYHYDGDLAGARFQNYEGMSLDEERQGLIETPLYTRPAAMPDVVEALKRNVAEQIAEGDGFWRPCSGCQESVDGYVSEKDYPRSEIFDCQPGGGCSECGGIGVYWDDTDYEAYARAALSPTDAQDGWNSDMEAAPHDGTPILAYGPLPGLNAKEHGWHDVRETKWSIYPEGSPGYADWIAGKGPQGIGWEWYEPVHNWVQTWRPTHWRTLPDVPTDAQGDRT